MPIAPTHGPQKKQTHPHRGDWLGRAKLVAYNNYIIIVLYYYYNYIIILYYIIYIYPHRGDQLGRARDGEGLRQAEADGDHDHQVDLCRPPASKPKVFICIIIYNMIQYSII